VPTWPETPTSSNINGVSVSVGSEKPRVCGSRFEVCHTRWLASPVGTTAPVPVPTRDDCTGKKTRLLVYGIVGGEGYLN
jgi:hypothetical protein